MKFFTAALLTSLTACPMASALGINCRGSSNCGVGYPSDTMQQLLNQVAGMDPRFTYRSDGRHITCVKNVCAFLQGTTGADKSSFQIRQYLQDLINHGCKVCGSDPTEPGNDVSKGQLTVNWVSDP